MPPETATAELVEGETALEEDVELDPVELVDEAVDPTLAVALAPADEADVPGIVVAVTRPSAATAPTEPKAIPAVRRLSKRKAASRSRILV